MSGTTFSRSVASMCWDRAIGHKPSYGNAPQLPETWEEALAELPKFSLRQKVQVPNGRIGTITSRRFSRGNWLYVINGWPRCVFFEDELEAVSDAH